MDVADIENRFAFHAASSEEKRQEHTSIREHAAELAHFLNEKLPDGREKSTAITKLEEVMFWANAAAARSQVVPDRRDLVTQELERTFGAYRLQSGQVPGADRWRWSFIADGGVPCSLELEGRLLALPTTSDEDFQNAIGANIRGISDELAKLSVPPTD